jgi:hypothetical protein
MRFFTRICFLVFCFLSVGVLQAQTAHSVSLAWGASPTVGATYNVYRGTFSGACAGPVTTTCVKLTGSPITGLSYSDTTPPQGATSFYVVRAVAGGVESANSNEVAAVVPLPSPAPPTGLIAKVN